MEKNSEDEEGQLEEQIERLQEKVESAQSEQKNLFLVIFQVRLTMQIHISWCKKLFVDALFIQAAKDVSLLMSQLLLHLVPICQERIIIILFMSFSLCVFCVSLWYLKTVPGAKRWQKNVSLFLSALHYVTDRAPGSLWNERRRQQHHLVQELHREATADLPHGSPDLHVCWAFRCIVGH